MKRTVNLTITAEDLPEGVHGTIFATAAGYYILTNARETDTEQAAAFLHECLHLYHDDLNAGRSADEIEQERHRELAELLKVLHETD